MGDDKKTQRVDSTVTATPEETELNKLILNRQRQLDPQITDVQGQQLDLASMMLGGGDLPGNLAGLNQGIASDRELGTLPTLDASKYTIGEDTTAGLVQKSLSDIAPQFQHLGVLDSGVAASLSNELAGDIRLQTDQSNKDIELGIDQSNIQNQVAADQFDITNQFSQKSFDINSLMQLLNLTLGGSTALQSPALTGQSQLSQNLGGLRSTHSDTTTKEMNPFVRSFLSSVGGGLGGGLTMGAGGLFGAMGGGASGAIQGGVGGSTGYSPQFGNVWSPGR